MGETLEMLRDWLAGELYEMEADPGTILSPDGWCERIVGAATVRYALTLIEPGAWCPPHHFMGMSTNTRGQARFTCELCGVSFLGWWKDEHEGYARSLPPPGGETDG